MTLEPALPLAAAPPRADRAARSGAAAAWVAPAHVGVVVLAAALYLVNLTVSGYGNTYYAAAAQAAAQSWSAWFFGSVDPANFITIDKPPLSTMLMGLSVRLFGLSSWAVLLPQALAGVATVALLYATVRRVAGPAAATIAALVCALTPAAVLMFRYDNPDAILTLLLVGAAWALTRAVEDGRLRWVVLSASLVGLAFMAKFLQAWLVLPAFGLVYVVAAPRSLAGRLRGLLAAAVTVVLVSGWWVVAMELIPADARPYVGGSDTNSALELLLGYNGLGRILGGDGNGIGSGPGGGFSGVPGLTRLLNGEFGGQVAWLLPFALAAIPAGLVLRGRAPRTDARRAAYLLWGGWLLVHAVVFSLMSGVIHTYYAVAMAPAIGALVGLGAADLWRLRSARGGWLRALPLAAAIAGSALVAWAILGRTPAFAPGLAAIVLALGLGAALVLAIVPAAPAGTRSEGEGGSGAASSDTRGSRSSAGIRSALAAGAAVAGLLALMLGPAAYAVETMSTAYAGGDPQAGPATADAGRPGGVLPGLDEGPAPAGAPPGPLDGGGTRPPAAGGIGPGGPPAAGPNGMGTGGGAGGVDEALVRYLLANRGAATWIVAVSGATEAGALQLASGAPVMAMGGFTGSDPVPTVAQLERLVAEGRVRYVLLSGRGASGGPGGATSGLAAWVAAHGTPVAGVGDGALYDLGS